MREDLLHAVPRFDVEEPIFSGSDPSLSGESNSTVLLEFYTLCAGDGADDLRRVRQMYKIRYELAGGTLSRSATTVVAGLASSGQAARQTLAGIDQVQISFYNGHTASPSFSSGDVLPVGIDLVMTIEGRAWPLAVRVPCGSPEEQQ